jgi:hypothetical protein
MFLFSFSEKKNIFGGRFRQAAQKFKKCLGGDATKFIAILSRKRVGR